MPVLYGLSGVIYVLVFRLFSYRKMVVVQNIARSFPEKRYDEVKLIVREFYRSLCDNMAEILKAVSISPMRQKEKLELVNFELIIARIQQGKHVIASMGHCGNWEMFNIIPFMLKMKTYAVYQPLSSKSMDNLMLKIRSRFGMSMITDRSIVRHLITNENPSLYFLLADQCPSDTDETSLFQLLHQPAYVFRGVEKLARKTNSCVFYIHVVKTSRGRYRIECKEISTNSRDTEDKEITQTYIRLLEQNIHENPSGWLWSHKRWKR
jgi:KDO2-lipid IV(A) lauroyltransferase